MQTTKRAKLASALRWLAPSALAASTAALAGGLYEGSGMESPFGERMNNRPSQDERITTKIDVSDHMDVRREALLAHATQIDPNAVK